MSSRNLTEKEKAAIKRLREFEPPEGYYVAFSGGKDSQCIYHLCKLAGVKFDAHYNVTSVDPPELVRFIKEQYPDVSRDIPHDKNGKALSMWNLIPARKMPPTRIVRYCCTALKESSGKERMTVTGVRWDESTGRKERHGFITVQSKSNALRKEFEDAGVKFRSSKQGGVVLNDDNAPTRRMVEQCYRTRKTLVNPIVDWTTQEVWDFLGACISDPFLSEMKQKSPVCPLYSEGFDRLGCIGCPMAKKAERESELARWPKYYDAYLRAFDRMLVVRRELGLNTNWATAEEVMDWWLERNVLAGQTSLFDIMEEYKALEGWEKDEE